MMILLLSSRSTVDTRSATAILLACGATELLHTLRRSNIICSSIPAGRLEVDDLQSRKAGKHDGAQLYAKDKRRMVALTERQAERWEVGLCNSNRLCWVALVVIVVYSHTLCAAGPFLSVAHIPSSRLRSGYERRALL